MQKWKHTGHLKHWQAPTGITMLHVTYKCHQPLPVRSHYIFWITNGELSDGSKQQPLVLYTWKMVKQSLINILFCDEGISICIMLIEIQQYLI